MPQVETITDFLRESNAIEGIHRDPTDMEIAGLTAFVRILRSPTVIEVTALCQTFQADARLRQAPGMDVVVGGHYPPSGGPIIPQHLRNILAIGIRITPFNLYTRFEWLHPFTEGNGRTGRALWLWRMGGRPQSFLEAFHYQTLSYMDDLYGTTPP